MAYHNPADYIRTVECIKLLLQRGARLANKSVRTPHWVERYKNALDEVRKQEAADVRGAVLWIFRLMNAPRDMACWVVRNYVAADWWQAGSDAKLKAVPL